MHKPFYASGFLYHSPSQQILLQQLTSDTEAKLVMFGSKSHNGENPITIFQQCVEKALGITIDTDSIRPIYDYTHDKFGEHFIFYIEIKDTIPVINSFNKKAEWLSLSKLSKFNMSEQTRHDITIGERVIRFNFESSQATLQS